MKGVGYMMYYFFNRGTYPNGAYNYMPNFSWTTMIAGGIIALLVIAAVIALIVIAVRSSRRNHMSYGNMPPMAKPVNPSLRLLDERYAKGEIGEEEYKTKKANLMA
jgi:putative membrane protein